METKAKDQYMYEQALNFASQITAKFKGKDDVDRLLDLLYLSVGLSAKNSAR